jgi:hypothetical protein
LKRNFFIDNGKKSIQDFVDLVRNHEPSASKRLLVAEAVIPFIEERIQHIVSINY